MDNERIAETNENKEAAVSWASAELCAELQKLISRDNKLTEILKRKLIKAEARLDKTRSQLEHTQAELDKANNTVEERDSHIQSQAKDIENLKAESANQKQGFEHDLQEKAERISDLEEKLKEAEQRLDGQKRTLAEKEEAINYLNAQIEEEKGRFEQELQAKAEETEAAEAKFKEAEKDIRSVLEEVKNKEAEIGGLKEELARVACEKAAESEHFCLQLHESEKGRAELQKQLDKAQADLSDWKKKAADLEKAAADKEAQIKNQEDTIAGIKAQIADLSGAEKELGEAKLELAQRFQRGWELFNSYKSLGAKARGLLSETFSQGCDFEEFIMVSARRPTFIVKKIREYVYSGSNNIGKDEELTVLADLANYLLELTSKKIKAFELLPVNAGDRFDEDTMLSLNSGGSKNTVSRVIIAGFKNSSEFNHSLVITE